MICRSRAYNSFVVMEEGLRFRRFVKSTVFAVYCAPVLWGCGSPESGYLVGVIAGLVEKDRVGRAERNTIGAMGGQAIPPVKRFASGKIVPPTTIPPH